MYASFCSSISLTVLYLRVEVPSAPPSNITVTAVGSTVVHVSWSPVPHAQRNGLVRGYKASSVILLTFPVVLLYWDKTIIVCQQTAGQQLV